jgi:uncharacterized membrane protein
MQNSSHIISILKKYVGGLFLTSVGLFCMYYFIYSTIEEIKQGNNIDYSFKGILIGPALFVMGIYLLVFTNGGKFSVQNLSPKEKRIFYLALGIGLALGFLALYIVNHYLEVYGYDSSNL